MERDPLVEVQHLLGKLQGAQEAYEAWTTQRFNDVELRIQSLRGDIEICARETTKMDVTVRGVNGDNGLSSRIASLERSRRTLYRILGGVVTALVAVAVGVVTALVRGWIVPGVP